MSTVRLSDVVVPEVFSNYMSKNTGQTMALYQQGVMRDDADLGNKLAGGGRTFNVPFWKDLDDEESDTASDDPDSHSVPDKLSSGTDIARRQIRTKSWSTMNLANELAGDDPMKRINERVAAYWARQFDDIAISSVRGVFADNIANDSSDMVNSIATDGAGAITSAELFSAEAVMDRLQNTERFGFMAVSLGYFDTLMSCSGSSTSSEIDENEQRAMGLTPGLVRLSVGLTGNLEERLKQLQRALQACGLIG